VSGLELLGRVFFVAVRHSLGADTRAGPHRRPSVALRLRLRTRLWVRVIGEGVVVLGATVVMLEERKSHRTPPVETTATASAEVRCAVATFALL
jgi:hypothetical protein